MVRFASFCIATVLTLAGAALAAPLSPSVILANPSSYDGKAVTVAGKVDHFQTSHTLMGTVAGYQLCDGKCIVVIDEHNAHHADGDAVTVSGTFHTTFKGPHRSFSNAVVIK